MVRGNGVERAPVERHGGGPRAPGRVGLPGRGRPEIAAESAERLGGALLLVLVCALVIANLYAAGRNARRRIS